ncbi:hypothetical protein QCA50_015180 [Cerrena zonata]|uniref:DUF6533 domain-containing protein n=1 Tax=Cerrena zonata TaxID=2478898 RepID=A0AAW0FJF1_9APHY
MPTNSSHSVTIISSKGVDDIAFAQWTQANVVLVPLLTIIIYDYVTTIREELNTLWRRKKSVASVALLVNRYALLTLGLTLAILTLFLDDTLATKSRSANIFFLVYD